MRGASIVAGGIAAALVATVAVDLATSGPRPAVPSVAQVPFTHTVAEAAIVSTAHRPAAGAHASVVRQGAAPTLAWTSASIATVWVRPGRADRLALAAHPDIRGWLHAQTLRQRRDLVSRVMTQSLRGDRLVVVGHWYGWSRVRLPQQRGSAFPHGIVGWVPTRQLTARPVAPRAADRVVRRRTVRNVLAVARSFVGTPYLWGGMSRAGVDCSGLTYRVFRAVGLTLPRDAADQSRVGRHIRRRALRPGDLVFFGPTTRSSIHHVGVYAGHGLVLNAPHTGTRVRLQRLSSWPDYWGARRDVP